MVMPTSSEPASPGPSVTATASRSDQLARSGAATRLVEHRDHPAQVGARGDLGHDAAGLRVERDLARDDVGDDPAAVLDDRDRRLVAGALDGQDEAAHSVPLAERRHRSESSVSGSQSSPYSSAERLDPVAHLRGAQQVGGHDQRVLAVVRVVARPDADRSEAEALVEHARRHVAEANLERRHARLELDREPQRRTASAARRCRGGATPGSTAKVVTCASSTISQTPA